MAEPSEKREADRDYGYDAQDQAGGERAAPSEWSSSGSTADGEGDVQEVPVFELRGVVDAYVLDSLKGPLAALAAGNFLVALEHRNVTARVRSGMPIDRAYRKRGKWRPLPGSS